MNSSSKKASVHTKKERKLLLTGQFNLFLRLHIVVIVVVLVVFVLLILVVVAVGYVHHELKHSFY